MDTIIDNSIILSIRRLILGESDSSNDTDYSDAENLLLFINAIILSDHIIIPGFIHDKIANKRDEGINLINNIAPLDGVLNYDPIFKEDEPKFLKSMYRG